MLIPWRILLAIPDGERAAKAKGLSVEDVLDEIYSGPKAALRPVHKEAMRRIHTFGDFEIAPKKGYVSLRRKKQFAMVSPATKTQVEIGINAKDLPASTRLAEQPPGNVRNHKLRLSSMERIAAPWRPWRAVAARIIWMSYLHRRNNYHP